MDFLAWRFVVASVVMIALRPTSLRNVTRLELLRGVGLGAILGLGYITQTYGLRYTSAAISTNQNALREPDLAKKDPYGKGWLVVIDPQSGLKSKTRRMFFEQKAVSWLNGEAKKLDDMVMKTYGVPLAATGGEIVDDIYGNLRDIKWEDLVQTFLHT